MSYCSAPPAFGKSPSSGLERNDFRADARLMRRGLLNHGYRDLSIASEHVMALIDLPAAHKDPFDRILIAQALVEGVTLLTTDVRLREYPGSIQVV
jgi:PIN domain nuclease of toxin-antitoxin system